jgi:hypothetical protein
MAAAAISAKVAIRKVQEKRRLAYEESIMTPEQRKARELEKQKRKKERETRERERRQQEYVSLSVFPRHESIIVSSPFHHFVFILLLC